MCYYLYSAAGSIRCEKLIDTENAKAPVGPWFLGRTLNSPPACHGKTNLGSLLNESPPVTGYSDCCHPESLQVFTLTTPRNHLWGELVELHKLIYPNNPCFLELKMAVSWWWRFPAHLSEDRSKGARTPQELWTRCCELHKQAGAIFGMHLHALSRHFQL